MGLVLPQHPSMGLALLWDHLCSPSRPGSAAHLHLEEDIVPAGLVELVGIEEECEDVVGIGTVFWQSLGILFGVAGRELGWGMVGDKGQLLTGHFCAETKP